MNNPFEQLGLTGDPQPAASTEVAEPPEGSADEGENAEVVGSEGAPGSENFQSLFDKEREKTLGLEAQLVEAQAVMPAVRFLDQNPDALAYMEAALDLQQNGQLNKAATALQQIVNDANPKPLVPPTPPAKPETFDPTDLTPGSPSYSYMQDVLEYQAASSHYLTQTNVQEQERRQQLVQQAQVERARSAKSAEWTKFLVGKGMNQAQIGDFMTTMDDPRLLDGDTGRNRMLSFYRMLKDPDATALAVSKEAEQRNKKLEVPESLATAGGTNDPPNPDKERHQTILGSFRGEEKDRIF